MNKTQMEYLPTTICRLCLDVVNEGNCKIIEETFKEILLILLKLSISDQIKAVICDGCSARLIAAFQFKGTCLDTEDSLFPSVTAENVIPVDLIDIYLKERGKEHLRSMLKNERVCRLCMQVVPFGFTSVEDVEIDTIQKCIPEIDFSSTKDPVICAACLDSLNTHSSFLKKCLDVEEQIKNFQYNKDSQSYVKQEEIEIKDEKIDRDSDNDGWTNGMNQYNSPQNSTKVDNPKHSLIEHESTQSSFQINRVSHIHERNSCNYETTDKRNLKKHLLTQKYVSHQLAHKKKSETKIFECNTCDYKTNLMGNLKSHQLIHKDISEIEAFEYDACDYKTKQKSSLKTHQLIHKDISETGVFKCDTCNFRTKYKTSFKYHQLTHKDISETEVFQCDTCDYKTKHKSNLKQHQRTHKDISEKEVFKCDICNFKTKYRKNLKCHQLTHKDISETEAFQCATCGYKTKRKNYLQRHQLIHKDISETEVFECDTCDYKTKHKNNLKQHQLIHKDISETRAFQCYTCGYKTKRKDVLKKHQLRHTHI